MSKLVDTLISNTCPFEAPSEENDQVGTYILDLHCNVAEIKARQIDDTTQYEIISFKIKEG